MKSITPVVSSLNRNVYAEEGTEEKEGDLFGGLLGLAHEAGDVEDVMKSGNEGEKDNDEISCRKIESVSGHGGEEDHPDRDDLHERT